MLAGGLFSAPLLCADLYDGWVVFLPAAGVLLLMGWWGLCCAIGGMSWWDVARRATTQGCPYVELGRTLH
jgi:hypothetical protein